MPDYSSPDFRWPANGEPIRVGSTLPAMKATPIDKNGPVDYSDPGNTITFTAYNMADGTVKVNGASASFSSGQFVYSWAAADVDTAGDFRGWFTVTSATGVLTVPQGRYIVYKIIAAGQ